LDGILTLPMQFVISCKAINMAAEVMSIELIIALMTSGAILSKIES